MSRIVAVHGVGQQFKGDAIIHREWWPALLSGIRSAGHDLLDPGELSCPFYGRLFRKPGTLAFGDTYRPEDTTSGETELLKLFWAAAADIEPGVVPSMQEHDNAQTLARAPIIVQRALSAMSHSKFWSNISQSALVGDVKQTFSYLNDIDIHEAALQIVLSEIGKETKVVIGHSLGSIIAYEALCRKPENVISFITLGSPLGIRNIVFEKLTPRPNAMGIGGWPGNVPYWTNIADIGDIVALEKRLAPFFGSQVRDVLVYNGSDAHHGERYLTSEEAGEAVFLGLSDQKKA